MEWFRSICRQDCKDDSITIAAQNPRRPLGIISNISATKRTRKGGDESMKSFLALWLVLLTAFAQVETTTSITGTVADQLGAVFPGALVKLTNQNTGAV